MKCMSVMLALSVAFTTAVGCGDRSSTPPDQRPAGALTQPSPDLSSAVELPAASQELPGEIVAQLLENLQGLRGADQVAGTDPVLILAYQILGATPQASAPEIKRSYRKLCLQYHPDHHNSDKSRQKMANECMAWLNWSYQTTLQGRTAGNPPGDTPPSALVAAA